MESKDYLPKKLQEVTLYTKITELLDHIIDQSDVDALDVKNKYRDFSSINPDLLTNIIDEFGYKYISDIFGLTGDEEEILTHYLKFVHIFKGHREGLVFVLKLLSIEADIIEWWEKEPQGEPNTFDLDMRIDIERFGYERASTIALVLDRFIRNYVYAVPDIFHKIDLYLQDDVPKMSGGTLVGVRIAIYPL